jgi:lipopolysaccharide O-acetyltransferase
MKKVIKYFYMLIFHPYLLLSNFRSKFLFIRKGANINHSRQIVFGNNVSIGNQVRINFFKENAKLIFGNNTYIGHRVSFLLGASIIIGQDTIIASNVCIASENHGMNPELSIPYKDQELICSDVSIGHGCWIGENVVILSGVNIGNKCVIGAGAIVTKNIPDYSIAVGNPARVIKKYDFDERRWRKMDD